MQSSAAAMGNAAAASERRPYANRNLVLSMAGLYG
jgi:hypothetical protein